MKTLVLIDFDRTLYKKDSLLEFTKIYKGKLIFYVGIIRLFPQIIKWKLGFITNEDAKKKYIYHFFKNEDYKIFQQRGTEFATTQITKNLNNKIFKSIEIHLSKKNTVFIVTASFSEWIYSWASQLNIKIISTKLEIQDSKLTGNFATRNCYGIEKVNRIKDKINLEAYEKIEVFGKGNGDFEMFQLAK